jgi:hypothetical protein
VGCVLVIALVQRGQTQDEIAEIENANATTEAENAFVTQTVQALQTEAARPTETPTVRPTSTSTATAVPPTNTPVVSQPETEATKDPNLEEPSPTATTVLGGGGAIGPTTVPGTGNTGGGETLPETGLAPWTIIIGALGLLAILIVARRLRTT